MNVHDMRPYQKRHSAAALVSVAIALLTLAPAYGQAASAGKNKRKPAATTTPVQSGKQIACPSQQELVKIPELVSSGGRLRASIVVGSQLQRFTFRYPLVDANGNPTQPGAPAAIPPATNGRFSACYEQWVRTFTSPDAVPPYPSPKSGVSYVDPIAGPTLRATVGDVIELGFLNKIDPGNFGNSIDRGDVGGCDESFGGGAQIYPKGVSDKYPDCFHGSTTANIHFHGTHTNPNTTGDNVFVEIVSSKRLKDEPTPAETTFRNTLFDAFFNKCESELLKAPHSEFPHSWSDLPALWTADQKRLLKKYDALLGSGAKKLWPVDERQLQQGAWPQYYFGAYPYCFRLPVYTPPPAGMAAMADAHSAHTAGAGSAEADIDQGAPSKAVLMGQAPGTHWYHAHKHGSTTIDVTNGMTGAFIIEGQYDKDISKYYDPNWANDPSGVAWTRKQPVMVINQLGVTPNLMTGGPGTGQDKGPDFSVNGRLNPLVPMHPGEVQLWRIVNTSSRAGAYFLGPPAGFHWKQIAQDGVQFNNDNYTAKWNNDASFLLAAGNRADLLVQAPDSCTGPCTFAVQVHNMVDPLDLIPNPNPPPNPPYTIDLMTVKIISGPKSASKGLMPTAPSFPDYLASIQPSEVTGTKTIAFASTGPGGGAKHTINGHLFDGEVGAVVLLNTVEEWTITNATANPNISHPFHIHINPFQVVETFSPSQPLRDASGNPVYDSKGNLVNKYVTVNPPPRPDQCYLNPFDPASWKPCEKQAPIPDIWWDVFPIPSGLAAVDASGTPINDPVTGKPIIIPGHFKMRSRFVDYAGYYVIHCHILAHEDRGMMTIVEVAPIVGPYSHH